MGGGGGVEGRYLRLETLTTVGINLNLRVREVELSISMPWSLVGALEGCGCHEQR